MRNSFENNLYKNYIMEHIKRLKAWGVLCDGENIFIVYRAIRDNPDYSLPKWHCEEWESLKETAYREVLEETWVKGYILWEIATTCYSYEGDWVMNDCEVHYFAMEVVEVWKKTEIDDVTSVLKFPIDEVEEHLTFDNDKNIIKKRKELYYKK